jgi:lysyl-tRNA synthetase class 2
LTASRTPPPGTSACAEFYSHRLAQFWGEPPAADEHVELCGRVTQAADDPGAVLFDDGESRAWLDLTPAQRAEVTVGDYLAIVPEQRSQASATPPAAGALPVVAVQSLQRLSRPEGGLDFLAPSSDWYRLQAQGRRRARGLAVRSALVAAIRAFFQARDFIEIEAPLQVPSPGLELHLAAFSTQPGARYLITSPEYQCKRLLAGGLRRIYSLGKVFRAGEAGPHHNPEFTMLEWYRAFAGWEAVADDVAALCAQLCAARPGGDGTPRLSYRGRELDLALPWPKLSVCEAMSRYAGVALRGDETVAQLRQALHAAGHHPSEPSDRPPSWDDLFFPVFLDHVEPHLAQPPGQSPSTALRPVVLYDWPLPLCALARPRPDNPAVVERFEAYIAGVELCNGFGELCDAREQRRRLERDAQVRAERGLPVYPQDERFLSALAAGMPPSAGVALGVDRLLMLLTDAEHIREVLPFASDEL